MRLRLALMAALIATPALAADPTTGARIFKAQCGACHSPLQGKNLVGPSLFGIVGRPSSTIQGYHYSAANKAANLTWDPATLDTYITDPRAKVPGTTMTYVGLKNEAQRADLIAYLETLK